MRVANLTFVNATYAVTGVGGRRQSTVTLDGASNDESWGRQTMIATVPVGAIQEMTVLSNAFSAEFDFNKPLKMTGVVTKVEFINPHSWIHIDVKDEAGKVTSWMIEGGSPNTLFRRGINKDSLPKGTVVIVDGYQAKDGTNRANGRDITLSDGKKLFVGGSTPAEQPK